MRKTAIIAPLISLAAGVAGYLIRRTELETVFDPVTGLAERGAAVTLTLAILSIAFVAASVLFSLVVSRNYSSPCDYTSAFAPEGTAAIVSVVIFGLVWLGASIKYALDIRTAGALPLIEIYFTVFSIAAALSAIVFPLAARKKPSGGGAMFFSVVPSLFLCFWLILMYKQNASNPVLISYCYRCLAIIALALSFYYTAGYVFGKPAPGKMLLSSFAAIFFCGIVLADPLPSEVKFICLAAALIAPRRAVLLLFNLERKKPNTA